MAIRSPPPHLLFFNRNGKLLDNRNLKWSTTMEVSSLSYHTHTCPRNKVTIEGAKIFFKIYVKYLVNSPQPDAKAKDKDSHKDARKRKMKGVAVESTEPVNLQGQKFANWVPFPNAPPFTHGSNSHAQQVLNAAAPFKSFTSMLAFAVEDGGTSSPADSKHHSKELDLIIKFHCETLRRQIEAIMDKNQHSIHCAVEERAAKKLKEMESNIRTKLRENAELERKAEHYKTEAQRLQRRVMYLEQKAVSLKEGLENATSARGQGENVQEDAESSFVDTERARLVRLDCMVCEKEIATVMIWPCRHTCLCSGCDAVTKLCPFCRSIKTTSVKVNLPLE